MSNLFATNFSDLSVFDTLSPSDATPIRGLGCNGGYVMGKAGSCDTVIVATKDFAIAPTAAGYTIRMQIAVWGGGASGLGLAGISLPGLLSAAFTCDDDGTLHFLADSDYTSASGVVNTTGSMNAIQVIIDLTVSTQATVTVKVNDTTVITQTVVYPGGATTPWTGTATLQIAGGTDTVSIVAPADLRVDNVALSVSYTACPSTALRDPATTNFCQSTFIPTPPAPAPVTNCTPNSLVSNGGKGAAGCNVGGIGFVPSYTGPYGTVPQHDDPEVGELLTGKEAEGVEPWIELVHEDYPSGDKTIYRRAFEELGDDEDYQGGRKPAGLIAVGTIEHGVGNLQQGYSAASLDVEQSDAREPLIRELSDDQDLDGDELYVKVASDAGRAAGVTPRTVLRGIVQRPQLTDGRKSRLTVVDALYSDNGPFGPASVWPRWKYSALGQSAPNMTADTKAQCMARFFGEKSDENSTDPVTNAPRGKGLIPFTFIQFFDLTGVLPAVAPSTGTSIDVLVAQLQASVTAGTTVADWGGAIGVSDATALEALGTVPADYTRLGAVIGYSDLDALLGQGTTPVPNPTNWGFLSGGLGEWFAFLGIHGSDLGNGDPTMKHDRTRLDLANRGDIKAPGYNWLPDGPIAAGVEIIGNVVRFTNEDGRSFDLTGIFSIGPLLDDHLNNVVNLACNAVGLIDADGLPIMHSERVKQFIIENDLINNWSSGALADDSDYPKFNDGVPKANSRSFDERQTYLDGKRGSDVLVSFYAGEQRSTLDWIHDKNIWTEGWIGVNGQGQVIDFGINEDADPSTWARIEHVSDIFGPLVRTSGEERQNVVEGSCDLDNDTDKFRIGPITLTSAAGIKKYKGRQKPGDPINAEMFNDQTTAYMFWNMRLSRLQFGLTTVEVTGPLGWIDRDVTEGVLLTSEDGPGADGYVDHPFLILWRQIDLVARLVTYTLLDVKDLLFATAYTNGLDRLGEMSDEDDDSGVMSDDDEEAALLAA